MWASVSFFLGMFESDEFVFVWFDADFSVSWSFGSGKINWNGFDFIGFGWISNCDGNKTTEMILNTNESRSILFWSRRDEIKIPLLKLWFKKHFVLSCIFTNKLNTWHEKLRKHLEEYVFRRLVFFAIRNINALIIIRWCFFKKTPQANDVNKCSIW